MSGDVRDALAVTDDAFLGDALQVLQPKQGYRAGVDAVLLAASVDANAAFRVADLGAGVGVVGLCVARRVSAAQVTLLEREADLVQLARQNVERNALSDRVAVARIDIAAGDLGDEIADESFDVLLANPPFHVTANGTNSAMPLKAASHAMPADQLDAWVRCAARLARPRGTFTMIHKADALGEILSAFGRRFGGVKVKPIHAREGEAAIRVLVQGTKGSRAPLELRPPLILHTTGPSFTVEVSAILRDGAALAI